MFAMLVGKLPFKVKPFNLKKLYQKMINGDMEVLPAGTSQGRNMFYINPYLVSLNVVFESPYAHNDGLPKEELSFNFSVSGSNYFQDI